jgi:ABC-type amino acid transport substrate-binding protein
VAYVAFSLVTAYWVLPGLVSALTPLRYRDIVGITRDSMITAFATGSSFVVIPMLAEHSKDLLRDCAQEQGGDHEALVDVIIPASYSFPHSAKILTLSFVVFAGWFEGTPIPLSDYPLLAVSGIASSFGSVNISIPFLLDLMELPHDLFQLFVATSVVNSRIGTLVQAMHVLALTLLGTCALTGMLRVRLRSLFFYLATTTALVVCVVLGMRLLFFNFTDTTYAKDEVIKSMSSMITNPASSIVHREPIAPRELMPDKTRLETVMSSGLLRLCYRPDVPPFTYFNSSDELVGFDVEMANSLARGLDLTLEFVPLPAAFGARTTADRLDSGYCDMVIGFPAVSMTWLGRVAYSDSYLDSTLAFLVEDHMREKFKSRAAIDGNPDLRIAFPDEPYYLKWANRLLPNSQIIPVPDIKTFLTASEGEYDAMLYPGESLAAYSLLNPRFGVVVPKP